MQSPSNTSIVRVRVLNASTGVCYPIALPYNELTRDNIQRHLAAIVHPKDQILLIGPPFKVLKDQHLRSNEILSSLRLGDCEDDPTCINETNNESVEENENKNSNDNNDNVIDDHKNDAHNHDSEENNITIPKTQRKSILRHKTDQAGIRRIFLFSKQALSETAPEPDPCILLPQAITIPTEPDPSPIFNNHPDNSNNDSSIANINDNVLSTPLQQALSIYERRFMLHLCQGRAYADAADLRLTSSRNCIQEQAVMVRALRAAVSNLSDHWNNATRTRLDFTAMYIQKMEAHGKVLNNFENILKSLSKIELDNELKAIARVNGRVMETLLDTVPVERMRSWANQCQTGYTNLQSLFNQLENAFDELNELYHREEDGKADMDGEQLLRLLEKKVEENMVSLRDGQATRLTKLMEDHKEVVNIILNAMKDEGSAQASFTTLEALSKSSSDIVPSMKADDVLSIDIMMQVANAKTDAMKRMKSRLRQISVAQNRLHRVQTFAGPQGTLRDTLTQHCEDMTHLEHLVELPSSYQDFIYEIRRRRAYGDAVTSSAASMMERLTAMRNDEVRAREKFVRGSGRHLMPSFYEMFVPTLATIPPQFTPQLPSTIEMDTLPHFTSVEEESPLSQIHTDEILDTKMSSEQNTGGDSSSLTDASSEPRDNKMSGATASISRLSITKVKVNQEKAEPLTVSTDEQSGNDVIMNSGSQDENEGKAEADAERKTLAYENAVLRQALERLGGKKPRTYVDQARQQESEEAYATEEKVNSLQNELHKVRAELTKTKSQLDQTSTALSLSKKKQDGKLCDKISHSSFQVGDVALFMPTGIGSGGKRTYVAFHSNCPHRFLSTDSIEGKPDYVLGRIIYQEELIAGPVGSDTNPHNLIAGTKFWILTVEVLKLGRGKGD